VVRYALMALESLDKVDDSLYQRFVAERDQTTENAEAAANSMRTLWHATFRPLSQLLAYCRKLDAPRRRKRAQTGGDAFDLGDFDQDDLGSDTEVEDALDTIEAIDANEIGDLVAGIGSEPKRSEADRWTDVLDKIANIHYGLATQYHDATKRMEVALAAGHTTPVLGLLDEATSTSNEGIHALVVAVYEAFVDDADPETVVPAYKTTLKRALAVRRGVATLLSDLVPLNAVLQGSDPEHYANAHFAVKVALHAYVESPTCSAMRAADRWEITQFEQRLATEPLKVARQTTEGLVKYLESLAVVNQREVLVQHDRRCADELREAITTSRELAELSARTARDIITKACVQTQDLLGRSPVVDTQIRQLASAADDPESTVVELCERIETLLAAAGL